MASSNKQQDETRSNLSSLGAVQSTKASLKEVISKRAKFGENDSFSRGMISENQGLQDRWQPNALHAHLASK